MKHKLFLLLAAIGMMVPQTISAYDFEVDGIYYNQSGSNATVTYGPSKYNSYSAGFIVIPSTVTYWGTTYKVTSIGEYAFCDCRGLTSVIIGSNVTSIGVHAFSSCIGLTSITIPNSVTSIGDFAFAHCCGLTSVTIPNSVRSIGVGIFSDCRGLTSVTIPNSVRSIGNEAFSGCTALTSVTIPNSVTSIGFCAFWGCSGLTSITIPNSVTSIGICAFEGCSGLTSITIPNSVVGIESAAFNGCDNLRTVISLATTPPSCLNNTFSSNTYDAAILFVPDTEGTLARYQTAEAWKYFKNIVANDLTGINNNRMSAATPAGLINLNGQYISNAQRGITLQQMPDGTTKKVLMR